MLPRNMLPKTTRTWVFWLILVIITYVIYYFVFPYPGCDASYEKARWSSEVPGEASIDNLKVFVRAPKWVADFVEREVEITIENPTDKPITATVALEAEPPVGRRYIYIDEDGKRRQQNTVAFGEIQPYSKVVKEFYIRVSGGQRGMLLDLSFRLNNKPFKTDIVVNPEFDRVRTLLLWVAQTFLLPPGANGLIPVFVTVVFYPAIRGLALRCEPSKRFFQEEVGSEATISSRVQTYSPTISAGQEQVTVGNHLDDSADIVE